VATDHGVRRKAATVAVTFNGLAQPAAEGDLVPVIRAADDGVRTKTGCAVSVFWSEQCHRAPPLAILPGLIPGYTYIFPDRIHRYRYRDRFAEFERHFSIAIAKAIPIANGTASSLR